jgi:hypothetical protein
LSVGDKKLNNIMNITEQTNFWFLEWTSLKEQYEIQNIDIISVGCC